MSYTATAAEIMTLRRMVGEYPAESSGYSDTELSNVIGCRSGDLHAAAFDVWMWKAAAAAALIDWSADGGDYKQAALYDRYKAAAEAEKAQSALLCGIVIDPTLKEVWE